MPLEEFLVVFLVLVGQADLARRLRVAEEFLRDRSVELVFLLLDIHEAVRRLHFNGERSLRRELLSISQLFPLLKID